MKRALLIVDRGSREPEVRQELQEICALAKKRGGYYYADYCFLEVLPPFIEEGIDRCIASGAQAITVMPYFLYPGMKLKDTIEKSGRIGREKKLKMAIAKPLSYHPSMPQLVAARVSEAKKERRISMPDGECDVLMIGHGSSDKDAHDAFVHTAQAIRPRYRSVHHCFLELDRPNIEEGIAQAVAGRPKVLIMVPYFLHKGAHIKRDVVNDVDAALAKAQFKDAYMARHLGVDETLVSLIVERTSAAEKELVDNSFGTAASRQMVERAFDIEKRSFEIIDEEAGEHGYDRMQWPIVRRVIHATADFDFASGRNRILFHPQAIESTFSAIKDGRSLVTDVDMVLAAINKKSLADLGLKATCYISDPKVAEESKRLGKTRSELAMRRAAADMDGGIVVIGNAPTALYEVVNMVREGIVKPALVVGMPVGFVSAQESKEDLSKANVPFITNIGRKGGSPAASSIINALLLLYKSTLSA